MAPASYDTTRDYRTILRSGAYTIGFAHLPHCVAGNIEVIAGMLAGANITSPSGRSSWRSPRWATWSVATCSSRC